MEKGEEDDSALMLRYRDGDVRAFERLYERHKGALFRYLLRHCGGRSTAEDLFQEVWGKVINSRARYQASARFVTFLFHIARNCTVDHFRRHRHEVASAGEDLLEALAGSDHDRPDAQVVDAQLQDALLQAIDGLPEEQREVFLLYEEAELSLDEIGQVTGVGMETAKSRLRYAVRKLRQALAGQHELIEG